MTDVTALISDYYSIARTHEKVFRGVLEDLRRNWEARPLKLRFPEDLDVEGDLEKIFDRVSRNQRKGFEFTVMNFRFPGQRTAVITIGNGIRSERLRYAVDDDDPIVYDGVYRMTLNPHEFKS